MTARPFRFGINLLTAGPRSEWLDKARRAEDLGYDVILVPDHLGMPAPFPALVAAAEVTTRPRLGTLVLNAGFYRPALLAREVASTDQLVGGRLEVGLGAGYVREEFEAAELPFPGARERVDHLAHVTSELRRLLAADDHRPVPAQRPAPPMMLAGNGDRLLRLAARHADIVGLAGVSPDRTAGLGEAGQAALAQRIELVRTAAGERFAELELNLLIQAVALAGTGEPDLSLPRRFLPDLSDDELLQLPGVLHGSEQQIAETLHRYRETYGLTYFALTEPSMVDFAKVINYLR